MFRRGLSVKLLIMPHIAVITSTRADWGLLSGPTRALASRDGVRVSIVATNMHLSEAHGHTVDEIIRDGFDVDERVEMPQDGDKPLDRARAMGVCLSGMAEALDRLRPDCVVVLGDRYEILAGSCAAAMLPRSWATTGPRGRRPPSPRA